MDHPPADQLRAAIADTRDRLADRAPDEARYLERVAENLEAILDRERDLLDDAAAATVRDLGPFVDADGTGPTDADSVRRRVDRALRHNALSPSDALFAALRRDAVRRLSIAKPAYAHPPDSAHPHPPSRA